MGSSTAETMVGHNKVAGVGVNVHLQHIKYIIRLGNEVALLVLVATLKLVLTQSGFRLKTSLRCNLNLLECSR